MTEISLIVTLNKQFNSTQIGIQTIDEELDLPYIYWIQKMHKNPYKHRFIADSSKCSTRPLSILLTKLLTHIKQGLQKYCETSYSRSGVNQMWILKNSKELLEHLQSPNFNHITSIKSFDFSTLYTTIPHQKLKSRLATIIRNSFIHKNGNRRYKRSVMITQEMCPIRAEISTHKNLGKCIYLDFLISRHWFQTKLLLYIALFLRFWGKNVIFFTK